MNKAGPISWEQCYPTRELTIDLRDVARFEDQEFPLVQVLSRMYEKEVKRGEVLIREGDSGADADEMYVVKSGHFEVSWRR